MSTTFYESIILDKIECGRCGGIFALTQNFLIHAKKEASGYTCPYCKTEWFWNETEADRLKAQLELKERELRESKCEILKQKQLLELEQQSHEQANRKLRRVKKGVCPCCKRHFCNLSRHMKTKHPGEQFRAQL